MKKILLSNKIENYTLNYILRKVNNHLRQLTHRHAHILLIEKLGSTLVSSFSLKPLDATLIDEKSLCTRTKHWRDFWQFTNESTIAFTIVYNFHFSKSGRFTKILGLYKVRDSTNLDLFFNHLKIQILFTSYFKDREMNVQTKRGLLWLSHYYALSDRLWRQPSRKVKICLPNNCCRDMY
jgi:hypothetical protein